LGIAPNKSVSKIASDFKKPDGLTIVPPGEIQNFLDPLPVTKLFGVGKKTYESLQKLGIYSVRDLRNYPDSYLESKFGESGRHLCRMATGIDNRDVQVNEEIKSISNETTFETDQTDSEVLKNTLLHLSAKVSQRLRKRNLKGKTIQLKIRFDDFTTFTRRKTLANYTHLTDDIYEIVRRMFEEFHPPATEDSRKRPVRLVGIGISSLVDEKGTQISLWDIQNEKKLTLAKTVDRLQGKFGKSAIVHANTIAIKKN
jgi:DNA polymerase-4